MKLVSIKNNIVFTLLSMGIFYTSTAQDIHFSQYQQAPLAINPAKAGFFQGQHRFSLNYKNQWGSVSPSNGYTIGAFSYDTKISPKKGTVSELGLGTFIYTDKAGESALGTTKIDFMVSGKVQLDDNQFLVAGVQYGIGQRSLNTANLRWDNQFDGQGHNSSLASNEPSSYESFSFGDAAIGLLWNYGTGASTLSSNDQLNVNIGVAYFHANNPTSKFNDLEKLNSNLILSGDAHWGLKNTRLSFVPGFLFMSQGASQEITGTFLIGYRLKEASKYTESFKNAIFYLGSGLRIRDAIIPTFMIEYGSINLGISYDVNISKLVAASSARGGVELSMRYVFNKE